MIMAWPFSSSVGADPHAYSSQVGSLPSSMSVARRPTESMWREIHEAISWLRVVDKKKGTYFISGTNIERTWIT